MAVLAVLAGGCGQQVAGPVGHPTDPATVVFQVEDSEGGPLAFPLPRLALFTLYGDGRFVTTDPLPIGAPTPALPTLRLGQLSAEGVQRVLQGAHEAGLLDAGADLGSSAIVDGGSTTFWFAVHDAQGNVTVEGLGESEASDLAHLAASQRRQRDRANALRTDLQAVGDWEPEHLTDPPVVLAPDRLAVFAVQPEAATDDWVPEPQVLPWPLPDLGSQGDPLAGWPAVRCQVVSGTDLEVVVEAAQAAHRDTAWEAAGGRYLVWLRPLLPHEHGCEDVRV